MSDKKMKRDDLGNRMKTFYEEIPKTKLIKRKNIRSCVRCLPVNRKPENNQ